MTTLEFIEKKRREPGNAYAVIVDNFGWQYDVLKRYAKDDGKQYAAWLVYAGGAAPFPEQGDTYVADVVGNGGRLTQVDGREPTEDETAAFAAVVEAVAAQPKAAW